MIATDAASVVSLVKSFVAATGIRSAASRSRRLAADESSTTGAGARSVGSAGGVQRRRVRVAIMLPACPPSAIDPPGSHCCTSCCTSGRRRRVPHHRLLTDRRRVARPHDVDRSARAHRLGVPTTQPAAPARGDVPAVSHRARRRGPARTVERARVVTLYGATVLDSILGVRLDVYVIEHLYATNDDEEERRQRPTPPRCSGVRHRDPHRARVPGPGGVVVPRDRGVPRRPGPEKSRRCSERGG